MNETEVVGTQERWELTKGKVRAKTDTGPSSMLKVEVAASATEVVRTQERRSAAEPILGRNASR